MLTSLNSPRELFPKLVRENLVERTTSPTDRRAILLRPTAAGLELKEQHARQINVVMQTISKDVKDEDFDIFVKVLAHLLEQINTLQPPNK